MSTIKIFIASSSELIEDRDQFRGFIADENNVRQRNGMFLELVRWENFLDSISDTRLQNEYNDAIKESDIVLFLFFTKVGKYTHEEFDTAYQVFKNTGKPKIWTYFKDANITSGSLNAEDFITVSEFKKKLSSLGHYHTRYTNIDNLINQFRSQLDKQMPAIEENLKVVNPRINDGKSTEAVKETVKNNFNELLTKRLIEAIRPYCKKANDFLITNSDWETNADLVPTAKRIIISGYVGVIGIQLRKLMSIGEEDFSESKMKRYLENCQLTAKRALQLISYALISTLWDQKLNDNAKLSQAQTNTLVKFFKNAAEENLTGFADLLRTLIESFSVSNLDLPIPQLKDLHPNLQAGSSFMDACIKLHAITELLKNSSYSLNDCTEAEKNLTLVLENLNFLAEYKMISIKDIGYNQQRNDKEGLYLHNYTLLEGDSQANNNSQGKVRKETSPVISYAVLLFRGNYRQNINLAPFIIDYNALGLNGGSKICFYSFCNTFDDLSLHYSFIEDNSPETIKKSKNAMPVNEQDFNKWLANPDNRKDMNFDNVFNLFNQAKKILAGLEEETTEDTL